MKHFKNPTKTNTGQLLANNYLHDGAKFFEWRISMVVLAIIIYILCLNASFATGKSCGTAAIVAINTSDQNLYRWTRQTSVSGSFSDAAEVGTNWSQIHLLASDSADGNLFAVHDNGNLYLYHFGDTVYQGGDPIGQGWSGIEQLIPAGNGVLYAVHSNGGLYWYRWLGSSWADGSGTEIGHGWGQFSKVFSGGNGVLYAIDRDTGELKWYHHTSPQDPNAGFDGPKTIGQGWGDMRAAVGLGGGVIYAITSSGELLSYLHTDPRMGSPTWANNGAGEQIGQGWDGYDQLTANLEACSINSLGGSLPGVVAYPNRSSLGNIQLVDYRTGGQCDINVADADRFLDAVSQAKTNGAIKTICIDKGVKIDLTGKQRSSENSTGMLAKIIIPDGVTIDGGGGRQGEGGATIMLDTGAFITEPTPLFIAGKNTHFKGLKLQGPYKDKPDTGNRFIGIKVPAGTHAEIANCELFGWPQAAIYVEGTGKGKGQYAMVDVRGSSIHNNQLNGLGYGVEVVKYASALIENNYFNNNRHSITGSQSTASYEAYNNTVGSDRSNVAFDMHGDKSDTGHNGGYAGDRIVISGNWFKSNKVPAIGIRGKPVKGADIHDNRFYAPSGFHFIPAGFVDLNGKECSQDRPFVWQCGDKGNMCVHHNTYNGQFSGVEYCPSKPDIRDSSSE